MDIITDPTSATAAVTQEWLSPADVTELVPGMSTSLLAQLRFRGLGPRYAKPSPRKVVYARAAIEDWLRESERSSTADVS